MYIKEIQKNEKFLLFCFGGLANCCTFAPKTLNKPQTNKQTNLIYKPI